MFGFIIGDTKALLKLVCRKIYFYNEKETILYDNIDDLDIDKEFRGYYVSFDFYDDIIPPVFQSSAKDWLFYIQRSKFRYKKDKMIVITMHKFDTFMIHFEDSTISLETLNNFTSFVNELMINEDNRINEISKLGTLT